MPRPTPAPWAGRRLTRSATADFSGSGNCAVCHSGLRDAADADVSIDTHWRSTMMANAARDPPWQATVASDVACNPVLREVIEDKCAACHTPLARMQASVEDMPTLLLEGGFLSAEHDLNEAAMDGVSCTLCHQVRRDVPARHLVQDHDSLLFFAVQRHCLHGVTVSLSS